ncbi:DegT/DnrJ/EryC1/StrS family aminotransferase [Maribacter sp. 2-571]|uniref:DegT/DnrJ/EryC1/StrS family aminotransferase n=1 Tax=Maribacter sp. 2-571 TaxID=3417569 RepID=UPI003D32D9FE
MPGFERFGAAEKEQVSEVLDTGVLMRYGFDGMRNGTWKALELERDLAKRMQVKHAQTVSSGTAALTVALASAGVGAGDEVLIPTFTFVASFEAILALGAVPILVNIDDTLTLDPDAVAKAVTKRTKVVMPVHMCGSMADLRALKNICDQHGLLLLEDACQAIGGTYEGKPLGSYGDLGCFSFDYVKTITCGEGGAIITDSDLYKQNADRYSDHGHDHNGSDRGAETHPNLGYNFRISELNAAVGVAQLKRLDEFLAVQERNYNILHTALKSIPEVSFRRVPKGGVQSYAFLNFFMPTQQLAKKVHTAFGENGIDACFYWYDNNWHYFRQWEHLLQQKSLGKMAGAVYEQWPDYDRMDFSTSDHWMGRTVSCLIKLGWEADDMESRAQKMAEIIRGLV